MTSTSISKPVVMACSISQLVWKNRAGMQKVKIHNTYSITVLCPCRVQDAAFKPESFLFWSCEPITKHMLSPTFSNSSGWCTVILFANCFLYSQWFFWVKATQFKKFHFPISFQLLSFLRLVTERLSPQRAETMQRSPSHVLDQWLLF